MICAGFLFWLAIAYFFYHRNIMGAVYLAVIAGACAAGWWIFSCVRNSLPRRPDPPPQSDLPTEYDFKDTKPSDFE
ncbi:MAG: hypothetical protein V3U53_02770 [bacterium]